MASDAFLNSIEVNFRKAVKCLQEADVTILDIEHYLMDMGKDTSFQMALISVN